MSQIDENVKALLAEIPPHVKLLAATKTQASAVVRQAIAAGVYGCGENRAQELTEKRTMGAYEGAPLHFIGHLQSNKLRYLVGVCDLIESVDSVELLAQIDKRASALGKRQDVLLEVNIGYEASKSGLKPQEIHPVMEKLAQFSNVCVLGLMTIPPISQKRGENRGFFAETQKLFVDIGQKKYDNSDIRILSMGMSGDYQDAIAEGSNLVRLGSAIFGQRTPG